MLLPWVLFPDNVVIWIWCLVLNSKTLWPSFGSDQNIIWFYDVNKHMNAHSPTNTSMHHAFHVDSNFNFPIPGSSAGQQETGSPRTSAASCVGIDQPRNKDREDDTTIGIADSDTNSDPQNVDTSALCCDVEVESPSNANIDAVSQEAVGTNPLKADSFNTDTDECSSGTISNSVSAPLYTCMQPVDLGQYIADNFENDIFCVAPGEESVPISVFNKEAECFPVLFPTGKDTFMDETRPNKITFSQYAKTRLFSSDNRFSKNPAYIFYLQYIKEFREVLQSAQISLRKGTPVNSVGDALTAEMLTSSQNLKQLVNRNEGYKFLKTVRGTSAYWENIHETFLLWLSSWAFPLGLLAFLQLIKGGLR